MTRQILEAVDKGEGRARRLSQTARLKQILRDVGVTDFGGTPKVRTVRSRFGEFQPYEIFVHDPLSVDQIRSLEQAGFEVEMYEKGTPIEFVILVHHGLSEAQQERSTVVHAVRDLGFQQHEDPNYRLIDEKGRYLGAGPLSKVKKWFQGKWHRGPHPDEAKRSRHKAFSESGWGIYWVEATSEEVARQERLKHR